MPTSFNVLVPGSVMLLGEHAVLHGYPAAVCSINCYMRLSLTPRKDKTVFIHSALGNCKTHIEHFNMPEKFRFILNACLFFQDQLATGFDCEIHSEFSDQIGLGSSAAVTVGMIAVLQKWLQQNEELNTIFEKAVSVIRSVQGVGSGADVAASTFGGVLAYDAKNLTAKSIGNEIPIQLIYMGYKTSTSKVIRQVQEHFRDNMNQLSEIYKRMGAQTFLGIHAIQKKNWSQLGEIFNQHQVLQKALGVSDSRMDALIENLSQLSTVHGAKISGAGLGDCIVFLFRQKEAIPLPTGTKLIDIQVSVNGVHNESN